MVFSNLSWDLSSPSSPVSIVTTFIDACIFNIPRLDLSLLVTEWAFCDEQDKLRRFSVQIVNDLNDRYIKYAYQLDRITRAPAVEELGRIYRESLREDIAWS